MSTPKTLFQKIADREIPAAFEYEDDRCFAIRDINPQAPTHLLVIPKKPLARLDQAAPEDAVLLGHLLLTAKILAEKLRLANGYRLVVNNGRQAGETVPHLHVHLLAGRDLEWPPG